MQRARRRLGAAATTCRRPGLTINTLIQAVRPTGRIGVVGVFVPEDPNTSDELAQQGRFPIDFGTFFFKGQPMGTGQANVKQYNRRLRNLIHRDKVNPGSSSATSCRSTRPARPDGRHPLEPGAGAEGKPEQDTVH